MRVIRVIGVLLFIVIQLSWAKFDPCRFNFGCKLGTGNFAEVDIIAQYTWQGTGLESDVADMLRQCKSSNKTPALYMYVIAKSSGLGDCNTGGGLCSAGAKYIRDNKEKIKGYYKNYASSIKNTFGTEDPVILFMEPDYYQYAQSGTQNGNPLSFSEAGDFIEACIDIIKAELPNAYISLDLSPWIEDQGVTSSWLTALPLDKVDFMNTSGGISEAGSSLIKSNNRLSWKRVHDITGKCIIADAGYGVGGGGTGHDDAWDNVSNINNRISDGVIGIIQFSPKGSWGSTINGISGQLSKPICSCGSTFSLTVNSGKGGSVRKDPDATAYDSGTTVTLTAEPASGNKFKSWGGDESGTSTTITVTMNSDKNISAMFIDPNAKPTYFLNVITKGSGMVKISPEKTEHDSGSTVMLEVLTINGEVFNGWSGALSGTATLVPLVMNADKNITATFSGNDVAPAVNLLNNGDFSGGTDGWDLGSYENGTANGTVMNGLYKLAIESTGNESWNIQMTQSGISLTKGETYELTFMASAESATTIIANVGMAVEPYTSFSTEHEIEIGTESKKHTILFPMEEASTSNARVEFNAGLASGTVAFSQVSLSVARSFGVNSPEPFRIRPEKSLLVSPEEQTTVSWYDYRGRLLKQASGNYSSLLHQKPQGYHGSCIAVIRKGDRQIVRQRILLNR